MNSFATFCVCACSCMYLFNYFYFGCFNNFCLFGSRILSTPKARPILVNGAVRKGERLIPPSSFEILMRITFPASSARLKVGTHGAFAVSEDRCIVN